MKPHSIHLKGKPRERGRQRGEQHKAIIHEHYERLWYSAVLVKAPATFVDDFVHQTGHLQAAREWTPRLVEEVTGISEGSGLPFNQVFALSCLDEMWRFGEMLEGKPVTGVVHAGCTSLGCYATADTPTLLGQNLDTSLLVKNLITLLRIEEDGRQILMVTYPGSIGLNGINQNAIGVCVNTIHLTYNPVGLPLQFRLRAILEKSSLEEAVDFLQRVKHGAAQNIMVGDAQQVLDFECSGSRVAQFLPTPHSRRVYHTNHPLANDDAIPGYPASPNSFDRFAYLEYRLADESKPIDLENIKDILRSHIGPICYHGPIGPQGSNTAYSVAYRLSSDPQLHLAISNPCENEYHKYGFE